MIISKSEDSKDLFANLIERLNSDLANELKHMMFYLHHASMVRGLNRLEVREFLLEQAASEMKHVQQFSDLIVGLGGIPTTIPAVMPSYTDARQILEHALYMENLVVENYTNRIQQAENLNSVDGKVIQLFLEEQLLDSRTDADNIKQMLK